MTPEQGAIVDALVDERRAEADFGAQLAQRWYQLSAEISSRQASAPASKVAQLELAVLLEQRSWLELFLAPDQHGYLRPNSVLPITHLFTDPQCPVLTAAWGPAAPAGAVLMLINELPAHRAGLWALLSRLAEFIRTGPPRCLGVAVFSAVTALGTERFDNPGLFTVEDPGAALLTTLSTTHIREVRRYSTAKVPLPTAILSVGNGSLKGRNIMDFFTKRQHRLPSPYLDLRTMFSTPSPHLSADTWRSLGDFTHTMARREIARVEQLLGSYVAKQQFTAQLDPQSAQLQAYRTYRELTLAVGWPLAVTQSLLVEGVAPIERAFTAWAQRAVTANQHLELKEEVTVLRTRRPTSDERG